MACLLDTNILARLVDRVEPKFSITVGAIQSLHRAGEQLYITPQNIIELRSLMTRSRESNGLAMSADQAISESAKIERMFFMLPDTQEVFEDWRNLVDTAKITAMRVYDARLVSVMSVHKIEHILTFNGNHFKPLVAFRPATSIVEPHSSIP
jgi:predicted nucleic acid-binding protein